MIVEARTVTVYVHTIPERAQRRRAFSREAAYRHAAWTKIRARCECVRPRQCRCSPGCEDWDPGEQCRFHDYEFKSDGGSPESPPEFRAPRVWGVPRNASTYGKAVAFRLARFYRYLDSKQPSPSPSHPGDAQTKET